MTSPCFSDLFILNPFKFEVQLDWKLFLSTYILIFLAELPDKTAFAILLMASRNRAWPVFLGTSAAFIIQSLVAVVFGRYLTLLPEKWVHLAAGILFLAFAVSVLRRKIEEDKHEAEKLASGADRSGFWKVTLACFWVIFIAEWGDLTQLATASLVAQYSQPILIFVSATLALWSVTVIAVIAGRHAGQLFKPRVLNRIAGAAFTLVGLYFIRSFLQH
jgi:putative Ca2+/H+ antiporter (TMEM165/GDT1 family)